MKFLLTRIKEKNVVRWLGFGAWEKFVYPAKNFTSSFRRIIEKGMLRVIQ